MSEELQLLAIARHLASLIDREITSSPGEPQLIIEALKLLIPEAEGFFKQVEQLPNEEEQWNHLINFIQTELFEEGMEFGFDKLDTEEIVEVYRIVVQMVEQAIRDQEDDMQDGKHEENKTNHQLNIQQQNQLHQSSEDNNQSNLQSNHQRSDEQNRTASGEASSSNQHNKHQFSQERIQSGKNHESLSYLENVRKQQQSKKQQQKSKLSKQIKSSSQPKQQKKLKKSYYNQNKHLQSQKNKIQRDKQNNKAQKFSNDHQDRNKISSVLSKPNHQNSSKRQNPQHPHNKSRNKQSRLSKNTQLLKNVDNQKQIKSQNDKKSEKIKKQRPNTAIQKSSKNFNLQKSNIQFGHQNSSKNKKSDIHLNQQSQASKGIKFERKLKQANIVNEPLQKVVIKTMQQVMRKKEKPMTEKKFKSNPLMRDNYVTEMMQKAARTYNYQAKNLKAQQQQNEQKQNFSISQQPQSKSKKNSDMKLLKKKQQDMESEIVNEQLKYYYQLRDKKLAYIKHMHKLMEKLQKERHIDLHKQQVELTKQEKQKIRKKIEQADNLFTNNMKQIKQNYLQEREKNRVKTGEEIKVLNEMEKNLVKNKQNELNIMKCLWEQERVKLDLIAKDEEKIKSQLQHMYRKNAV